MKKTINTILFLTLSSTLTFASSLQQKDLSAKQMSVQKDTIMNLASKEFSKNAPTKIDKYTTFTGVKVSNSTLIWNFDINTGAKSDQTVQNEDHSKMEKAVTQGVCIKSKRFFDSDINISYVYNSAKTHIKLFQFDINYEKCLKLFRKNKIYY